jgi:hypothetical protein
MRRDMPLDLTPEVDHSVNVAGSDFELKDSASQASQATQWIRSANQHL